MTAALLVLAAYLVGSIPTSYLAGRFRGIDLREHGSGNLGATNALRVLGWKAGIPVFTVDILKGFIPAIWFPLLDGRAAAWAAAYGAAAVLGHMFSVFVGFRGGKGVATSAGVFLALAPGPLVATLAVWTVVVVASGYVSLGSIVAAIVLPALVALTRGADAVTLLAILLGIGVLAGHRGNMRRLRRGEEHRFRRRRAEVRS
jgi:acyl phosphate:glycerol-3-phosphate acyltransferase